MSSPIQAAFDATMKALDDALPDRPAPEVIHKGGGFGYIVGGNAKSACPVFADKYGRLWKEDALTLTLVYDPVWHSQKAVDRCLDPK